MNVFLAEFIGVTILIFLGCGILAGNSLNKSGTFKIGSVAVNLAWGFAVALAVYAVGGISGAHLNPALTLAQAMIGKFDWNLVPGYILAQVLGAMFGSLLVYLQFLPHWEKTDDAEVKLSIFATSPSIKNNITNFISEYLVTFVLIFSLSVLDKNDFVNGVKPLVVGCLIFSLGICFGGVTGTALNPARDFGPRLAHFLLPIPGKGSSNFKYSWIPILAPIMGGTTGAMVNVALYEGVINSKLIIMLIATVVVLSIIKIVEVNTEKRVKYINKVV